MATSCSFSFQYDQHALDTLSESMKRAIEKTAFKLYSEKVKQQQIPFRTGNLQNVTTDVDDSAIRNGVISIRSMAPYAERLYFNPQYNFNHTFNRNAKGEWWEDYITGDKKHRPEQIFKHYYKQEAGDYID